MQLVGLSFWIGAKGTPPLTLCQLGRLQPPSDPELDKREEGWME